MSSIAFTIMTWNIASFGATKDDVVMIKGEGRDVLGKYYSRDDGALLNQIANYVMNNCVDIVLIQELFVSKNISKSTKSAQPTTRAIELTDKLLSLLESEDSAADWTKKYSKSNSNNTTRDAYLFLWKTKPSKSAYKIKAPTGTVLADTIYLNSNALSIWSENYRKQSLNFGDSRKPAGGVFKFQVGVVGRIIATEYCLITNLHAVAPKRLDAEGNLISLEDVPKDVHKQAISDCIQAVTVVAKKESNTLKLPTIMPVLIGGDFNFDFTQNLDFYNDLKGNYTKKTTCAYNVAVLDNTTAPKTTLNNNGLANAYDNFLISKGIALGAGTTPYVVGSTWDVPTLFSFKNNFTDHLPVIATFTFPDPNKPPKNS